MFLFFLLRPTKFVKDFGIFIFNFFLICFLTNWFLQTFSGFSFFIDCLFIYSYLIVYFRKFSVKWCFSSFWMCSFKSYCRNRMTCCKKKSLSAFTTWLLLTLTISIQISCLIFSAVVKALQPIRDLFLDRISNWIRQALSYFYHLAWYLVIWFDFQMLVILFWSRHFMKKMDIERSIEISKKREPPFPASCFGTKK